MNLVSLASVAVGIGTLRANPLRTVLSTLGVIIGVAALVAILSLGDGLEQYSRSQIELTTDLQTITVTSRTIEQVDGVAVRRPDVRVLGREDAALLDSTVENIAVVTLSLTGSDWATIDGDTTRHATLITATLANATELFPIEIARGRFLDDTDFVDAPAVAVISAKLAADLAAGDPGDLLDRSLSLGESSFAVVGVLADPGTQQPSRAYIPLGAVTEEWLSDGDRRAPVAMVKSRRIEDVDAVRTRVEGWLEQRFGNFERYFTVSSSERRIAQARQAILVFKLSMGAITGISLLVGGIGIMNVLLASVTERTREIGVRKAVGARRNDIMLQFLAESIAIAGVGSLLGVMLGMAGAFASTAIIRMASEAPLQAAFTWSTMLVAVGAAVFVGLAFGTYPARRAARLSVIEAIRHE
jgi:putative ABC transport system permease protein